MPGRFETLPIPAELIDAASRLVPIPLHGIGLSICSATLFDEEYAQNLIETQQYFGSPWISEHLSFSRISTGHEMNAAVAVPAPYDGEILDLLVPRVEFFTQRLSCPFLLENSVYYFTYGNQDLSEEEFLNELCARTGCGLLLDLHNLYCNAVNHGFAACDYLRNLDLSNVIEIHVAGGVSMMGFHTDSHTGQVPEPVWSLLEETLPEASRLRAVTFEFHESSFPLMGDSGVLDQIQRARRIVGTA